MQKAIILTASGAFQALGERRGRCLPLLTNESRYARLLILLCVAAFLTGCIDSPSFSNTWSLRVINFTDGTCDGVLNIQLSSGGEILGEASTAGTPANESSDARVLPPDELLRGGVIYTTELTCLSEDTDVELGYARLTAELIGSVPGGTTVVGDDSDFRGSECLEATESRGVELCILSDLF